jgi:hypothetical protein
MDEEALLPEVSVVCCGCGEALPVIEGLDPWVTLWMHELDCPAWLPELAA